MDNINEQTVVRVDFDKIGVIKVLNKDPNVQNMVSTLRVWPPDIGHTVKVVGTVSETRYYLDDILIYTELASSPLVRDQLRFVHNNGTSTAYFSIILRSMMSWCWLLNRQKP